MATEVVMVVVAIARAIPYMPWSWCLHCRRPGWLIAVPAVVVPVLVVVIVVEGPFKFTVF